MAAVNGKVTPYKRLRDVVFIDAIPVSAAGKVLKREARRAGTRCRGAGLAQARSQGAKALSLCRRAGRSSGRCRSSTVRMSLSRTHASPAGE